MKKVTKLSLALAATLAFGFAAVACGDGNDGDDGKKDPTDPPKYTVSYAIGTGATGTAPSGFQKEKDAKFALPEYDAATATFSKEGSTFDGWLCSADNVKYDGGVEYTMPDKNVTFTAQWVLEGEEGTTYTITYDLNGGTGTTPTEDPKAENATFTVASDTGFGRENYKFGGWSDGKTTYEGGETYTVGTSNITFTAQWTPKPGVVLPEEDILEYEGDCTLPSKTFAGKPIGGENIVGIAIDTENGDLYYKLKDASGWIKSKTKYSTAPRGYMPDKYGDSAPYYEGKIGEVNYNVLFKPDYSELTLCTTDDDILDGGVFTKVVQQTPAQVTVKFDLDYYGSGVENPADQKFAGGGTATDPQVSRDNYRFDGWHVGKKDGDLFNFSTPVTSDMTLVAAWTYIGPDYTITYTAPAGATGDAPASATANPEVTYTVPENTFIKEGWTFYKWQNTESGGYVNPKAKYGTNKNITYVAVFQKDYTVVGDEYYTSMTMLDNGNVILEGYTYACTISNGILIVSAYEELKYKFNEETSSYVAADNISSYATNCPMKANGSEVALTFDGFGTVTLGSHTGTYDYNVDTYAVSNITFADATESTLAIEYSMYQYSASGAITFGNGDSYTFGTVTPEPGPGPEDPDAVKLSDFADVTFGYASHEDAGENILCLATATSYPAYQFSFSWNEEKTQFITTWKHYKDSKENIITDKPLDSGASQGK